jgi:hypothetical protein
MYLASTTPKKSATAATSRLKTERKMIRKPTPPEAQLISNQAKSLDKKSFWMPSTGPRATRAAKRFFRNQENLLFSDS